MSTKPTTIVMHYVNRVETLNANNKLHSFNDKPAIIFKSGECHYYKNGKLHRDGDKPAITGASTPDRYFKNGVEYTLDPAAEKAAVAKVKEIDTLLDALGSANRTLQSEATTYIDNCVRKLTELSKKQDELASKRDAAMESLPIQTRHNMYRYYDNFDASEFCRKITENYVSTYYNSNC